MIIKKPFENADISANFYLQLSKIPYVYRELYEMSIQHQDCLIIDYPVRILISLNKDILINVYDHVVIIIHNYSIILLTESGKTSITLS